MYMAVIPTYKVTFTHTWQESPGIGSKVTHHATEVEWRVPKDSLEGAISVLLFNNVEKFAVELEHPLDTPYEGLQAISSIPEVA